MTFAVFHDFPGLENALPKLQDFPWLSRASSHPDSNIRVPTLLPTKKIQDSSRTFQDPVKIFQDLFGARKCLNIKKKRHLPTIFRV